MFFSVVATGDDISPEDSASSVGVSSAADSSSCAPQASGGSSAGRGTGKKAAKLANETKHFEHSIASSQRQMAKSAEAKIDLIARQTIVLEQELAWKQKQAADEMAWKKERSDMNIITARTDGMSDMAKELLEMKMRALMRRMMAEEAQAVVPPPNRNDGVYRDVE